jgi:large subunit ribosomal protein L13
MKVIDGSEHIMGRLATYVAKQLLDGEDIVVVNAEKIVITGKRESILADYKDKRKIGKTRKGPIHPRMPDRIFRRTVRGMVPYQRPRGRTAYKKLRVYVGVPKELEKANTEQVENALDKGALRKMYLGDLSKLLGAKF